MAESREKTKSTPSSLPRGTQQPLAFACFFKPLFCCCHLSAFLSLLLYLLLVLLPFTMFHPDTFRRFEANRLAHERLIGSPARFRSPDLVRTHRAQIRAQLPALSEDPTYMAHPVDYHPQFMGLPPFSHFSPSDLHTFATQSTENLQVQLVNHLDTHGVWTAQISEEQEEAKKLRDQESGIESDIECWKKEIEALEAKCSAASVMKQQLGEQRAEITIVSLIRRKEVLSRTTTLLKWLLEPSLEKPLAKRSLEDVRDLVGLTTATVVQQLTRDQTAAVLRALDHCGLSMNPAVPSSTMLTSKGSATKADLHGRLVDYLWGMPVGTTKFDAHPSAVSTSNGKARAANGTVDPPAAAAILQPVAEPEVLDSKPSTKRPACDGEDVPAHVKAYIASLEAELAEARSPEGPTKKQRREYD